MNSIIYILCPYNVVTGGVELLHQLCYKLRLLGYDARIVYLSEETKEYKIPKVYEKYQIKIAGEVIDESNNILIVPEVYLFYLPQYKNIRRVIWWLSIDNAKATKEEFNYALKDQSILHFSQSAYATESLLSKGVPKERIYWLSDYINSEFLHLKNISDEDKRNEVLFNPRKGYEKTSELIKLSNGYISWRALTGFNPSQMRDVLQKAKIYIDFGSHPGRDRIPRESTMCGCLLITNRKGSAANNIDIPIPDEFKINHDADSKEILKLIYRLIDDYALERVKYKSYCERSANEFMLFETDILTIFEELLSEPKSNLSSDQLVENILSYIAEESYEKAFAAVVKYRKLGYKEDEVFLILEATIRLELGEINEAEYIAKRVLKDNPNNYEILLILARIHLKMKKNDEIKLCVEECQQAIVKAQGTEDEEIVNEMAMSYIDEVKALLQ